MRCHTTELKLGAGGGETCHAWSTFRSSGSWSCFIRGGSGVSFGRIIAGRKQFVSGLALGCFGAGLLAVLVVLHHLWRASDDCVRCCLTGKGFGTSICAQVSPGGRAGADRADAAVARWAFLRNQKSGEGPAKVCEATVKNEVARRILMRVFMAVAGCK